MHIHILGICGTFMGGIAALARQLGHQVTGSDANVYPPMSTLLEKLGVTIGSLDDVSQLDPAPDLVIIGNALSRGNPQVETVLNQRIPYTSGPQWLGETILRNKWVLAVAGTHGKTTTSTMLAHILQDCGMNPGFLIGGVVERFNASARLTDSPFFVIEADEYDTAFFDKRSKFVHYHPDTLALNNLEFDHADIFADLAAIERQFHHLIRTVPGQGAVIADSTNAALQRVIEQGCWSEQQWLNDPSGWQATALDPANRRFQVKWQGQIQGEVEWLLLGEHNQANALMAIAAAQHAGVPAAQAIASLSTFSAPKRRLELIASHKGLHVYDDFAHHPTAIASTLAGLRALNDGSRILAVIEPRSNTMRAGVHKDELGQALADADMVYAYDNGTLSWSLDDLALPRSQKGGIYTDVSQLSSALLKTAQTEQPTHLVLMSNGNFGGLREHLLQQMKEQGDL